MSVIVKKRECPDCGQEAEVTEFYDHISIECKNCGLLVFTDQKSD